MSEHHYNVTVDGNDTAMVVMRAANYPDCVTCVWPCGDSRLFYDRQIETIVEAGDLLLRAFPKTVVSFQDRHGDNVFIGATEAYSGAVSPEWIRVGTNNYLDVGAIKWSEFKDAVTAVLAPTPPKVEDIPVTDDAIEPATE